MAVANGHDDLRERGTGELIKQLSHQVSTIARLEVALAKAEVAEKGKKAGIGAGMLGGAAVAALLALGSLTAFLIMALAIVLPEWAAALLVTALWGATAAVLGLRGKDKLGEVGAPVPEKTVDSVKEDVQWLKGQTRSAAS
jgi:hypothetical protein